jgi:hypothetical protein
VLAALIASALAASGQELCRADPITGVEQLWSNKHVRWVIIGEEHGTTEMPAAFGDLACLASKGGRRVFVAIEQPRAEQAAIDAFLSSDGSAMARETFLRSEMWRQDMKDGRSSRAYFELFDRLRRLKRAGAIAGAYAFVPERSGAGNRAYNRSLAQSLKNVPVKADGLVLVLMGNLHAMKTSVSFGSETFWPTAAMLPRRRTVSIELRSNGGAAWNCAPQCGVHVSGSRRWARRGISFNSGRRSAFDGVFELGVATTASPPAAVTN